MHESGKWKWSRSVVSYSSRPHGLQPTSSSVHGIFQARVLEWGATVLNMRGNQKQKKDQAANVCFLLSANQNLCQILIDFWCCLISQKCVVQPPLEARKIRNQLDPYDHSEKWWFIVWIWPHFLCKQIWGSIGRKHQAGKWLLSKHLMVSATGCYNKDWRP